jgi:hypothetical protein
MKKFIVSAVMMMVVSAAAFAQNDAINKFFTKYQNDDSFSLVNISGKMFSMMANIEGETQEDKDMIAAVSKIKGLKILKKEGGRDSRALYNEAISTIPGKEFEELMSIRQKDNDIKFYTKEASGKISELVMVMGGNEDFMVMSVFGDIDLKEISKMGKSINIDGLNNLQNIKGTPGTPSAPKSPDNSNSKTPDKK